MQQELIANVVQEVLRRMNGAGSTSGGTSGGNGQSAAAPVASATATPASGLFTEVEPAVVAAERSKK